MKTKYKPVNTVIIKGWEYEIENHDGNKCFSDIVIPPCWELWTDKDTKMWNDIKLRSKLNLGNCWFWIKPKYKNLVAGFGAGSDGIGLGCLGDPTNSFPVLGVRFKRKVKK